MNANPISIGVKVSCIIFDKIDCCDLDPSREQKGHAVMNRRVWVILCTPDDVLVVRNISSLLKYKL